MWATGIATRIGDRTATFELGRRAIRGLQRSGDRLRTGITLHMIANTLATTRPEAATIIYGAAEAYVVRAAELITSIARQPWAMTAYGNSAPAGRTWTGIKPSPTPSPTSPTPSTTSNPRPSHERAVDGHGGAATELIIGTRVIAGYGDRSQRVYRQLSRPAAGGHRDARCAPRRPHTCHPAVSAAEDQFEGTRGHAGRQLG